MAAEARDRIERPYRRDHETSGRRAFERPQPKGLPALLTWFLAGWAAEVPSRIHVMGVWRDRKRRGDADDYQPVGGSALGAPRMAIPFELYIESGPFDLDQDGAYQRPMHAALARLAGYGNLGRIDTLGDRPFMARYLFRLAVMYGDVDVVAASVGAPPQMARVYTETALALLARGWRPEPERA